MFPIKLKAVAYRFLPCTIAIGLLLLAILGIILGLGLGLLLNHLYDDPSAGQWTQMISALLFMPATICSFPWVSYLSSFNDTYAFCLGLLINTAIGQLLWWQHLKQRK